MWTRETEREMLNLDYYEKLALALLNRTLVSNDQLGGHQFNA